jgi:hypothetical protein
MRGANFIINTADKKTAPITSVNAKIIWPSFIYNSNIPCMQDLYNSPNCQQIKQSYSIFKKHEDLLLGCREFWTSFLDSMDIYIIDKHFEIEHLNKMINLIINNESNQDFQPKNIVILSYQATTLDSVYQKRANTIKSQFKFSWPKKYSEHFHDRFVLMDKEIWHCGATIGGMHNSINALTRGWIDNGDFLKNFIENIIKGS